MPSLHHEYWVRGSISPVSPTHVLVPATPTPWPRQPKGAHSQPAKGWGRKRNGLLGAASCKAQGGQRDAGTQQGARGEPGGEEEEAGRGGQRRGRPHHQEPLPAVQVPGERGRLGTEPSRTRCGPGFNHPSVTHCLLLLTAHLLALVKHTVNSERISPALPDQRKGQDGAGLALPRAAQLQSRGAGSVLACSHRRQPRDRERRPGSEKCCGSTTSHGKQGERLSWAPMAQSPHHKVSVII